MGKGYYLKVSEQDSLFEIEVSPLSERDIAMLFDENYIINIKKAHIQYFGLDKESDGYYTENDLPNNIGYSSLLNFIYRHNDYSINLMHFMINALSTEVILKDEIITKIYFRKKEEYFEYLLKILKLLKIKNPSFFSNIILRNKNKYICIDSETSAYEIFDDFWLMQEQSKIVE